jgi:hypothetical protein
MDTQVVKSGSAEHNRQNGHKKRNDDPQCNRNLPAAPEGGFAEKPPADVSCQQTGNGKKYEKKQNHANPYGIYSSVTRFSIVNLTDDILIIHLGISITK